MKLQALIFPMLFLFVFSASCSDASGDFAEENSSAAPAESRPEDEPGAFVPDPDGPEEYAGGFTKGQRQSDAAMIVGILERGYAPRAWKEEFLGLSFEENSRKFFGRAGERIDDLAFYEEIARYLVSFKDSHIFFSFPSNAIAKLPFEIEEYEGRFFVASVDMKQMPEGISLEVGDEILSLCGRSPEDERAELLEYLGEGNPRTAERFATAMLTSRRQSSLPRLPDGACEIAVAVRGDGTVRNISLEWERKGDELAELNDPGISLGGGKAAGLRRAHDRISPLERLRNWESGHGKAGDYLKIGMPDTFVPLPESFISRKERPFPTGVMEMGGRKVGYLRIHTYSQQKISFSDALSELEEEIAFFEDNTDALVIDQTANGGGSLCFGWMIASFFFAEPVEPMKASLRANRYSFVEWESYLRDENLPPEDLAVLERIVDGMRVSMKRGDLLTEPIDPCSLSGTIEPYTGRDGKNILYTKPVLILVDELSISCGDAFPAQMQDSGRATIFGARTAGAGGAIKVLEERFGYSEIQMSYTLSLGVRTAEVALADGKKTRFIENVGALPDVPYAVTSDDFLNGYRGYAQAMEGAVSGLFDR